MNRYDTHYIFRHAQMDDLDAIMRFIRDEWPKKNHILSTNKDLFLYEYQNSRQINFILAINRQTMLIDSMYGYYPASRNAQKLDIFGSMWCTRKNTTVPMLGVEVIRRCKELTGCRYLAGVGINPKTALPLHKTALKMKVFTLKHYYMLSERNEYKVAEISSYYPPQKSSYIESATLVPTTSIGQLTDTIQHSSSFSIPLKDEWYINKRFFSHPVYKYKIWKIIAGNEAGLLVGREIDVNGIKILRLVDFMGKGDLLDGLYDEFHSLIEENKYEYIDFYIYGVDDIHLTRAGFTLKTEDDANVIPNMFEPFVQKNSILYGAGDIADMRLCKADADQDRPNKLKN